MRAPISAIDDARSCHSQADEVWQEAIARQAGALLALARTPEDLEKVQTAYDAELALGPPTRRIRRKARFCPVPVGCYDRNQLARIIHRLEIMRSTLARNSAAIGREQGKKQPRDINASVIEVAKALARLAVKYRGKVFPSLTGLAYLAGVGRSTVARALAVLERAGFVAITRRRRIVPGILSQRHHQDTNAYCLTEPRGLFSFLGINGARAERQNGSASKTHSQTNTRNGSAKGSVGDLVAQLMQFQFGERLKN